MRRIFGILYRLLSNKKSLREEIAAELQNEDKVLEIGPFFKPFLTGPNVKYFDVLDKDGLTELCKQNYGTHADLEAIPDIDYVSSNSDLSIVEGTYSAVVSSHVIEHQDDLISHINQVADLLVNNGYYYIFVPDKQYCFDHFVPESSLAQLVAMHKSPNENKRLENLINHFISKTHNNASRHWIKDHGQRDLNSKKLKDAINAYHSNEKLDIHNWYFTDKSFVQIIEDLRSLELIKLRIETVQLTRRNDIEFFVKLKKVQ